MRKYLQVLHHSILAGLAEKCFCSSRHRKLRRILLKQIEESLDLRTIMRNQFDVSLILSLLLSKEQQTLFEHQRARIVSSVKGRAVWSTDSDERHSNDSQKAEIRCMKNVPDTKQLIGVLKKFKAESTLDRNLLKGLLIRREKSSKKLSGFF